MFNQLLSRFSSQVLLLSQNSNEPTPNPKSPNPPKLNNTQEPGSNKNGTNRKVIINLIVLGILVLVIGGFFGITNINETKNEETNSFSGLLTDIRAGKVSKIELNEDKKNLTVDLYKNLDNKKRDDVEVKTYPNISPEKNTTALENIKSGLADTNVKFGSGDGEIIYAEKPIPWYTGIFDAGFFQTILILGVLSVVLFLIIRRLGEANNRSISFGNMRSKNYDDSKAKKITFADVAGNDEAKQELFEVVDFLKRPDEYITMGAKIPKGVLLVGSPGNGKTLMARAIAGEAEVPFIYVSGSEFVEMFVGVGASRVRDLFRQAKKKAPCVIFIDEIDAVGRQRGAGLGGGNDEREQTLNQILVEMDGFEPTDYIILIGATNRPDVLDPALLRPGRFDRQITVTAPDRKEREAILRLHSKNKKFASDVDFGILAKRTPGFSGADLQNILNEAAILAVREKSKEVTDHHTREAIEKVMLGPSLKSKVITEAQKKLTAYHEAGHALIQTVIPECSKVQKITIIPRGRAAGYTFNADNEVDPITRKKSEFMADITALFGGYATEELIFGEVSTGASNDLQRATETAKNMVTKYGMSSLGPISFDEGKGMSFLGRDMMDKPSYSEESAKKIDEEVKVILALCYQNCKKLLNKHIADLHKIAGVLIDKEVIEYEEFSSLIEHLLPAKKKAPSQV